MLADVGTRVFVRIAVVSSTAFVFVACSYDFTVGSGTPPTDSGGADAFVSVDARAGRETGPLDENTLPEEIECAFPAGCTCASGAVCNFHCVESSCQETCGSETTCNLVCVGGGCHQDCGASSSCNVDCTSGNCSIACAAGSTCTGSCTGGGCVTQCAPGAHCNVHCTVPTCVCTGAGCE